MYVYKTTNLINGLIYIGISKKHSINSLGYIGSGKKFQEAVKEFGKSNFSKEILVEDINFEYYDLQKLEIFLIDLFDARNPSVGYNLSHGGDGNCGEVNGMFNKNHTETTRKKISETRLVNLKTIPDYGKKSEESLIRFSEFIADRNKLYPTLPNGHSENTKKSISNTMKEKAIKGELHKNHAKFTEERKQEYSEMFSGELNPFYGKQHTEESKLKIREAIRLKFPPVNKVNDNGIIVKTYESITDVTEDEYRPDLVKKVLKGENKKHGGFYWEYI